MNTCQREQEDEEGEEEKESPQISLPNGILILLLQGKSLKKQKEELIHENTSFLLTNAHLLHVGRHWLVRNVIIVNAE